MNDTAPDALPAEDAHRSALRTPPNYRHPRRLLAAGFAAGLLANAWFVDAPLGVGFFVFALGWVVALRALGGRESWQRAGHARLLLLPLLACAAFVAVRDAPTLVALNVLAVGALACLCVQLFAGERALWSLGVRGYLAMAITGAARGVVAGPVVVTEAVDLEGVGSAFRGYGGRVARATALAVPLLVLFGGLLASADEVFSAVVSSRLAALTGGGLASALSNAAVVAGVALISSGLWAVALRRRDRPGSALAQSAERRVHRGTFEAFAIIGSLLVLFAGFSAIQAAVLFGHVALPSELTWAEYARQGFFQLLIVACLTLVLITVLSRAISLPAHLARPFAAACSALVALTLLILASAVKRLTLYEEAYGFTELRVYSHVFSFSLGAMLLWRAVTLWRWHASFATGALVASLGFVLFLDVLNPDAFIATKNLARGEAEIDFQYLGALSADASQVLSTWPPGAHGRQAVWGQHERSTAGRGSGGWASANFGRWRAARLFDPKH